MDHNNKHLLPGFQFPAAFAGLANAGTNLEASFLSALSQFSTIPAAILPTAINPADLAQYVAAAQHSNQQAWLVDQAKVAAMLPSLYLSSVADVKNFQLAQQSLQASVVNGSSSSNIFPNLIASKLSAAKYLHSKPEVVESPINVQPLSNASSSHQSTSTPHEIDVGSTIHTPQALAFDLSAKNSPAVAKINDTAVVCEPSTSTSSVLPTVLDSSRVMSNAELEAIDPTELLIFDKRTPQPKEVQRSKSECVISTSLPAPATGPPPPSAPPTKRTNDEEADDHDVTQELFTHFPAQEADDAGLFGVFGETVADGGLSPVQFTPPDSPTGFLKEEPASLRPTPSSTPFLPAPAPAPAPMVSPQKSSNSFDSPTKSVSMDPFKVPIAALKPPKKSFAERMAARSNKVPIYKQKRMASYRMDNGAAAEAKDDAYSFEDEDEHSLTKLDMKEQLDQEVKEKLSRLASQSADRNKNIYVPGVGFAVPQEHPQQDLWRNVLLKKRPVENRPAIPSANLLPASVHAEACQAAARLAEPEIVTLAESLRRRKRARFVCNFIKTEALPSTDSNCFKQEGSEYKHSEQNSHSAELGPKLPKLIIKLPRKSTDECVEKKKKKKKRKHEEDDSDWEDDRRPKKHKHKKNKERRDSGYELRLIDQEGYENGLKQEEISEPTVVKEEPHQEVVVNPKKRFMQQWHEQAKQENGQPKFNGVEGFKPPIRKSFPEFNTEAIKQRLNKFSQADGNITKGCFVVNKSELFRDDCALWKVDNPNMLQKFPPRVDPTTKNVTYKNSSTYSGWCEQISSGYYKVAVKFIKQSRSESIVEPEVPLADLFPAMTSELTDSNALIVPEEETKHDPNEGRNLLLDQRRMSLYILYREVIDHALTLEHLQLIKEKNDWNYLKAYTDIEKINGECMSKLRSTIKEDMEDVIKDYTRLIVTETQKGASGFISLLCQACKSEKKQVEKVVQLLGRQGYDRETFQYADKLRARPREEDEEELEPLIATEFYFCEPCATAAQQFHQCYHMMFDLFRFAEEKLETLGTIHSEYKPETIVEIAKKSRTWQNKHFTDIIEMWKRIESVNVSSSVPT